MLSFLVTHQPEVRDIDLIPSQDPSFDVDIMNRISSQNFFDVNILNCISSQNFPFGVDIMDHISGQGFSLNVDTANINPTIRMPDDSEFNMDNISTTVIYEEQLPGNPMPG
jgi:hypothetical protein